MVMMIVMEMIKAIRLIENLDSDVDKSNEDDRE